HNPTVCGGSDFRVDASPRKALLLDVAHEMVAFGLQFVDAPLHDVANADNRCHFAVDHDRDVADSARCHDAGKLIDAVLGGTGLHIASHDHGYRFLQHANTVGMQMAHHVTLTDDA